MQGGALGSGDALFNVSTGYFNTTDMRNLEVGQAIDGLLGWSIYGSGDAGFGLGGTITGSMGLVDPLVGDFTPTWVNKGIGAGFSVGAGGAVGASYTWPVFNSQFNK